MSERRSGLGDFGRQRIRENIGGKKSVAGHELTAAGKQRGEQPDTDVRDLPTTEWEYPGSSRVYAYQYDYKTSQLRVRFVKYGDSWVYDNVPTAVFQVFDASPSKGQYINSTLNHMAHRRALPFEESQYFTGV